MLKRFEVGQNSLEAFKVIVNNNPSISSIKLISHAVGNNWRQINPDTSSKIKNLRSSFEHTEPYGEALYTRSRFLNLQMQQLKNIKKYSAWSVTSKVLCKDDAFRHVPMMNFHPEGGGIEMIKESLKYICGDNKGCILNSGRFFHYYGDFLLDESEWINFMAEFLMPCVLVSPRYIGHRLYYDSCSLRLTADKLHKPKVPTIIEVL